MINRKNLPLYVALAIPVVMILLVAAFIYLPGIGQPPRHNFIYASGNNIYAIPQQYQVVGGRLSYSQPAYPPSYTPPQPDIHFYLYDISKNEATEINFAQAQSYQLDPSATSDDGYTIEQGNSGGGDFLFGGVPSDYNDWFIKGHNRSKKLNLKTTAGAPSYGNFQFLGWIE